MAGKAGEQAQKWVEEVLDSADELEILDARKCAEGDKSASYWSTIIGFHLRDIEGAMSLAEVYTGEDEATDKALCEAIVEGLKLRANQAAFVAKYARMEAALKQAERFIDQLDPWPTGYARQGLAARAAIAAALSSAPVVREGEGK